MQAVEKDNVALLSKALEIHDLLKGLAGRPLRLPPVVAALHNPPFVGVQSAVVGGSGASREKRLITKAAAKMMGGNIPTLSGSSSFSHSPSVFFWRTPKPRSTD